MCRSNIATIAALAMVIVAAGLAPMSSGSARHTARPEQSMSSALQPANGPHKQHLPVVIKSGAGITNVANGAQVAQTITLLGSYHLAQAEDIWVFVMPENELHYPQSMDACKGELTPKVNGRWEMRAGFGRKTEDVGVPFKIITTVATPQATRSITATLQKWCQEQSYPGMVRLPEGVTVMESITVTRTAELWGPAPPVSNKQLPGQLTITSPTRDAHVSQTTTVTGSYTPTAIADIWVLVYATNGRWYPQSSNACAGEPARKAGGKWQIDVSLGGPLNAGEPFDIVAVLADAQASAFFRDTQKQWCEDEDYPGFLTIELPKGIEEKSRIRVYGTAALMVDDFAPQARPGDPTWFHNRLGGDRERIDGPGSGSVSWGRGVVTATITAGTNSWRGAWTSLNHPIRDCAPLTFSALFPPQIKPQYQARVTNLRINVLDGRGTFQAELQYGENTACPPQITTWRSPRVPLSGGPQNLSFDLPPNLGAIQNLNWLVLGGAGDFVAVDQLELTAAVPQLTTAERAFLWSYAMLLANWDPSTGLTRDLAYYPSGEFDNISASGMQAAAAVMAWRLGFISQSSATEIVTKTTQALLALPRCHGLWPHFARNQQIVPGTEWSSIDTIIAVTALIEARAALGLDTAAAEQALRAIDWPALILGNGSISHGYVTNCIQRIEDKAGGITGGWRDFGTESWLVNLGYAAATGNVAAFDHTPPTFNGSGFIDELAWLLVPVACRDRWGMEWCAYRQQAADRQLKHYQGHPCYGRQGLFGLSAAEVPDPAAVAASQIYQAFGVGGEIPANDGTSLLGHAVIVPHYVAMIASLRPPQAYAFWEWLGARGLFTPLNNVESLMLTDKPACKNIVWNALKGSWNLSLQTLGWGRLLVGTNNPLYQGMSASAALRRGYTIMSTPPIEVFGH